MYALSSIKSVESLLLFTISSLSLLDYSIFLLNIKNIDIE